MKHAALSLIAISVAAGGTALADPYRNDGYRYDDYRYEQPRDSYSAYRSNCHDIRDDNRMLGAIIGGVAGGVIGDNVAARGVRTEGRVLGAIVGAVTGSQIGQRNVNCEPERYGPAAAYQTGFSQETYRYEDSDGWSHTNDLYGANSGRYDSGQVKESMQECQTVTRITKLPDGREIHEPTLACRDMQYGPWTVPND